MDTMVSVDGLSNWICCDASFLFCCEAPRKAPKEGQGDFRAFSGGIRRTSNESELAYGHIRGFSSGIRRTSNESKLAYDHTRFEHSLVQTSQVEQSRSTHNTSPTEHHFLLQCFALPLHLWP